MKSTKFNTQSQTQCYCCRDMNKNASFLKYYITLRLCQAINQCSIPKKNRTAIKIQNEITLLGLHKHTEFNSYVIRTDTQNPNKMSVLYGLVIKVYVLSSSMQFFHVLSLFFSTNFSFIIPVILHVSTQIGAQFQDVVGTYVGLKKKRNHKSLVQ